MTDMRMDTKQMIQHSLEGYYPSDGMAYLFGSRARGDANPDSDWDILLLINKQGHATDKDYHDYAYPLVELGVSINEKINPIIYTLSDWQKRSFTPFHHNVMREGIKLCH